jgi:hypothetical protein
MVKYLAIIVLALAEHAAAQDIFFEKETSLRNGFPERRETLPVPNPSDGTLSVFLVDLFSVHGLLFDRDYRLINEIEGERPKGNFSDVLGCSLSDGSYNLFYSSSNHKTLTSVSYSYNTKSVKQNTIELPLKKENFATAVSFNGKFYFLTSVRGKSILRLYSFKDGSQYEARTYDFSDKHFFSSPLIMTLDDALNKRVVEVDNQSPNAIDLTSKKSKLYAFGDKIVLTLDNKISGTNVITIDLKSLDATFNFFRHAVFDCGETAPVSTNSYIHNNLLYQMKVCPSEMRVQIRDLLTGTTIKEFKTQRDEEISFRNTPIMQEKEASLLDPERELPKTAQFLRKVARGDAGLCAYISNSELELIIGGIKKTEGGPVALPTFTQGSSIQTPYGLVTNPYNPTFGGFMSYLNTKSVYFRCRLEPETFAHQPGAMSLKGNAFDRIQQFIDGQKKEDLTARTVFRKNGVYFLAYYIKDDNRFTIRIFE